MRMDVRIVGGGSEEVASHAADESPAELVRRHGGGILFGSFDLGPSRDADDLLRRARGRASRASWCAVSSDDLSGARVLGSATHGRGALVELVDGSAAVLGPSGASFVTACTLGGLHELGADARFRAIEPRALAATHADTTPLPLVYDVRPERGVGAFVAARLIDEARADELLPLLLETHDPVLALFEARGRLSKEGREDAARELEQLGKRRGARWTSLVGAPPRAMPACDPVEEVISAGLALRRRGTFTGWSARVLEPPESVVGLLRAALAAWEAFRPEVAASLKQAIGNLSAEDVVGVAFCLLHHPESLASWMDGPVASVVALLRATHPWRAVPLLVRARWPGLLEAIDALITYRTPASWSRIDEYELIETRRAIAPFDAAHLTRLRAELDAWARAPDEPTDLELAYVLRVLSPDPSALASLPERAAVALAEDVGIQNGELVAMLGRGRNVRALLKLARSRGLDLDDQIVAAEAALALGHGDARELAARLKQTRDRRMRKEGY